MFNLNDFRVCLFGDHILQVLLLVMKNITRNFDLNVFKFKKIIYLDIILIFLQKKY